MADTKSKLHAAPDPEPAAEGDMVFVNYTGVLSEDGTRFASNLGGEPYPVTIGAGDVIPGWDEGLVGATAGSQIQIDVPADAGYGDVGVPSESIPAGAALSFLVDMPPMRRPTWNCRSARSRSRRSSSTTSPRATAPS